jgi:hypothetical protein
VAASGLGIQEDVLVVEGRDETDVRRQQHPVAEHVAGHVADARDGEVLRLRVHAELAEVALDALPGAARRDAHLLVVVARGAARGEGVASQKPYSAEIALATSEKLAVPLSAATTRYGSSGSRRTTRSGGTTSPPTRLSVRSRSERMKRR